MARVPSYCPPDFFHYSVVTGDTIFNIAQRMGVDTGLIIANNPHISNPALILPGDKLCVPFAIKLPCSTVLGTTKLSARLAALGASLAQQLPNGQQSISILATGLPNPSQFGNFDAYEGFISFPGIGSYGFLLYPTPERFPTWSGTITIPRPILFSGTPVMVRTTNTTAQVSPQTVLQGSLCALDSLYPEI